MKVLRIAALLLTASAVASANTICTNEAWPAVFSVTAGTNTATNCGVTTATTVAVPDSMSAALTFNVDGGSAAKKLTFSLASTHAVTISVQGMGFSEGGELAFSGSVSAGSSITVDGCSYEAAESNNDGAAFITMTPFTLAGSSLAVTNNAVAVHARGIDMGVDVVSTNSEIEVSNNVFTFVNDDSASYAGYVVYSGWKSTDFTFDNNVLMGKASQAGFVVTRGASGKSDGKVVVKASGNVFNATFVDVDSYFFTVMDTADTTEISFTHNVFTCETISGKDSVGSAAFYSQNAVTADGGDINANDYSFAFDVSDNKIEACPDFAAYTSNGEVTVHNLFAVSVPNLPNTAKASIVVDNNVITMTDTTTGPAITFARKAFQLGNKASASLSNNAVETTEPFVSGTTYLVAFSDILGRDSDETDNSADMKGSVAVCGNSYGTYNPMTTAGVATLVQLSGDGVVIPKIADVADCGKKPPLSAAAGGLDSVSKTVMGVVMAVVSAGLVAFAM